MVETRLENCNIQEEHLETSTISGVLLRQVQERRSSEVELTTDDSEEALLARTVPTHLPTLTQADTHTQTMGTAKENKARKQ